MEEAMQYYPNVMHLKYKTKPLNRSRDSSIAIKISTNIYNQNEMYNLE